MQRHRKPGVRPLAAFSALGLAIGVAAALPGSSAQAEVPLLAQALADPTSAASAALDPAVIEHFPAVTEFALSPELAQILGRTSLNAVEAAKLLSERGAASPTVIPAATPEVGTARTWPALDQTGKTPNGVPVLGLYLKEYTLKAKRDNIEIWVASAPDDGISTGTQFPPGDCRSSVKDPTEVTEAQAQGLADEFQDKMLPIESKFFSVAPAADGTLGIGSLGAPLDFRGNGNSVVTLVDNVRDENFYDFQNNRSYIAGFFAPIFNQLTNRNVMTIDAFDWEHRTGANPKNEPSEDICQSRPARPRQYESTFAHEYQHLLHSYTNASPLPLNLPLQIRGLNMPEELWINEGLSDMAPMFVGYDDPKLGYNQTGGESHIFCFQGYGEKKGVANPNPVYCGGPENSLTLWEDQVPTGPSSLLADYGNAWSFLIFLYDRYGAQFLSDLHRDPAVGFDSLQALLDKHAGGAKVADVLHDFQLMNLVDNMASVKGAKLIGADRKAVTTRELTAEANYRYVGAYGSPGAAPNGADYVLLRNGKTIAGKDLRSLVFAGSATVGDTPVESWTIRLVGIDRKGKRTLVKTYDSATSLTLGAADLKDFAGYKEVVAIVSLDDIAQALSAYVPYTLTVNGALQPGGA